MIADVPHHCLSIRLGLNEDDVRRSQHQHSLLRLQRCDGRRKGEQQQVGVVSGRRWVARGSEQLCGADVLQHSIKTREYNFYTSSVACMQAQANACAGK
jgi:hypothetical protein